MPRGVPKSGKRRTARRNGKIYGVQLYSHSTLLATVEKQVGKPKVVDLGDRWAILSVTK